VTVGIPAAGRRIGRRVAGLVGGRARLRVIGLLAGVLALNTADTGTIGAAAAQLERDLRIGHAQLGLLSSVAAAVGALACLPAGVLADRVNRVRLLAGAIAAWSVAMTFSSVATSYLWLLASRAALGAAVAAAGPVVASLVGDLFAPPDRARAYGWILSGELVGAGLGLLIGADISAVLSWRYAFLFLAMGGLTLAAVVWRALPEPIRGGASWVPTGARQVPLPDNDQAPAEDHDPTGEDPGRPDMRAVVSGVSPSRERVRPTGALSLRDSFRYLVSIPTIRLLVVASSIGYFFFSGLRTFSVVFVVQWYGLPQTVVSGLIVVIGLGALAGVLLGGRLADRAVRQGIVTARVGGPALCFTASALLFAPGLLSRTVAVALPVYTAAAAALSAANPPLDAARLDVVPANLWGRAESLRTVLRLAAEAFAPAVFGVVADHFGSARAGNGLRDAFLIMLVPLLANGVIAWYARRSYPSDVATAVACDELTQRRAAG
jgi:predicted MFS family arabinose efflux permease